MHLTFTCNGVFLHVCICTFTEVKDLSPSSTTLSLSLSLLQLEDDIVARPNYFTTMKNFALQQPLEEWMILEFSQLGFIGESLPFVRVSPIGSYTNTL